MVEFKNLPDTTTPINAENLNKVQTDLEDLINEKTDIIILHENEEGTIGNITLNEDASNFKYIEIFFKRISSTESSNEYNSSKVVEPNGKYVNLSLNHTTNGAIQIYGERIYIEGINLIRKSFDMVHFNSSGFVNYESGTSILGIVQIIGYR